MPEESGVERLVHAEAPAGGACSPFLGTAAFDAPAEHLGPSPGRCEHTAGNSRPATGLSVARDAQSCGCRCWDARARAPEGLVWVKTPGIGK